MNRIKEKIRENLDKRFNIDEIDKKDPKVLRKEMARYNNMIEKQYRQGPSIISTLSGGLYLLTLFFAYTVFSVALVIFAFVTIKTIYNLWNIYSRRNEKYKNKIYSRRAKFYKAQYPIHAFLGLFGVNYIIIAIEVVFMVILMITKNKVEEIWNNFDQDHYRNFVEESPFQRRTRIETEKENEYYYKVKKYLMENGK